MMSYPNRSWHILLSTLLVVGIIVTVADVGYGQKKGEKKKQDSYVMTEAELQAHLMGFADRFAAFISQSFETYDELAPPLESRRRCGLFHVRCLSDCSGCRSRCGIAGHGGDGDPGPIDL